MARLFKKRRRRRPVRRVHKKRLAILGGLILLGLLAYYPAMMLSERAARRSAMAQIRASQEAGNLDLVLRGLANYTATWPGDVEGMELRGRLLAESATTIDGLIEAALVNDQLLRLDPVGPARRETRRRLVRLYIQHGQALQRLAQTRKAAGDETRELRFQAAAGIARQLTKDDPKDAEAHRLLAQALDGLVSTGSDQSLPEAVEHYEDALRLDPGDIPSAERLATIDLTRRNDRAGAEKTLADLLAARPGDPEARLARWRFFLAAKDRDRARAELDAALALAPESPMIRKVAASQALERGDLAAARAHLDAIPAAQQGDLAIRLFRGEMDLQERNPDRAIERYREGLLLAGGSDQELTFRLARTLIKLGRPAEARPVVDRFEKLEGDGSRPIGHYLRGLLEEAAGRPARAIPELERAAGRTPPDLQLDLDIQMALGQCHELLGDEARAMIAFQRASAASARSAAPIRAMARLQMSRDPRKGLEDLERALAKAPGDPGLLVEVGRARLNLEAASPPESRDWGPLGRFLDEADRRAPNDLNLMNLRVNYLIASGRRDRAIELAEGATRGPERKHPEPWIFLAKVLENQGRRDAGIKALEEAAGPDAAGDLASIRVARAQLLANAGRGQAARDVLTKDIDRVPRAGRPDLARALGLLLRGLGDRAGARAALAEWARLMPDNPRPGLTLMDIARADDDDEAARLGLEALRAVGDEQDPYGLAARALELLRPRRARPGEPADAPKVDRARLDEAGRLVARLQVDAPQLPIGPLLRGMILQQEGRPDEAIAAYKLALKEPTFSTALTALLDLLIDRKMFDEVDGLKRRLEDSPAVRSDPALAMTFDRVSAAVSLRHGDKARAEQAAAKIVEMQPDSLQARGDLAKILDAMGRPQEAEATLRELVSRRPESPDAWAALVTFQSLRGAPGEAARTVARVDAEFKGDRPELIRARCRWIVGEADRAAKLYGDALAARPDDMPTLRAAIGFYQATNRPALAEPALRRVLKTDPSTTWAARLLAQDLSGRRDPAAWAEAWSLIAPGSSGSGDSPDDRLERAVVLARSPESARRAEAEPILASLADDIPTSNPIGTEVRCRLAQSMLQSDRPADAEKSIAPAADEPRPNPLALALDAEALARTGRVEAAARRVDQLAAIEPKSGRLTTARAWVLHASGKPAEAAKVVEDLIAEAEAGPAGEAVALAGHDLLSRIDQAGDAARVAARVAARWPRHAALLARHQVARGDVAGALASCRAAVEAGAPAEAAREASGLAVARRDDPAILKEVDDLIVAALAKGPKTFDIPVYLATLRHVQGRYEEEVALYRDALALNPPTVRFLNNMAWTLSDGLRRHDEALARIDEVIRREGTGAAFLDTRGVILGRLGKLDPAIADLEESCRLAPAATSYFHLARVYLKAGKADQHARCRDLARKAKLDPATIDANDKADLVEVMGPP